MTNATTLRAVMTNHITKVMQRYKGKVHAWDVVNEAWGDNPPALRESVFKRVLGSSYIDDAFIAARAADLPVDTVSPWGCCAWCSMARGSLTERASWRCAARSPVARGISEWWA